MTSLLNIAGNVPTDAFAEGSSLRFEDGDSAYLSFTPASAGNRKTWTWSGWVKRGNLGSSVARIFNANDAGSPFRQTSLRLDTDQLRFYSDATGVTTDVKSSAVYRDASAWYHIVLSIDTTQATASNRVKMYVNSEQITSLATSTYPSQNLDMYVNEARSHQIGASVTPSQHFDGYIANVAFIDGQALTPTSFGEYEDTLWKPKSDTDIQALTFGTNGFYLPMKQTTEAEGFSTVTYTGTGNQPNSIEGVGFEPDFVWLKNRTDGSTSHTLFDSVRGAGKMLQSDSTSSEASNSQYGYLSNFDSSGFTLTNGSTNANYVNVSGKNYVAWCWDAGTGSAASNTDGSITSSVKANTTNGFSIVSYTGTGANATVGHGLSSAPEMMIVKSRNSAGWLWGVYHTSVGNTGYLRLNDTTATTTSSGTWQNTSPTSSVFSIGTDGHVNYNSSTTYIAYCFHSVSGYSDFGSYSGTGASGNAVTLGFEPAFVMIKRADASGDDWVMVDTTRSPVNPRDDHLSANSSAAETSGGNRGFDTSATGFTINHTGGAYNTSGGTYIYMAFKDTRDATFFGDTSGNGNNWTPNALNNTDVVPDSPVTNFATLNPLQNFSGGNLGKSEGNLKASSSSSSSLSATSVSPLPSSGKWYFEVLVQSNPSSGATMVGLAEQSDIFGQTVLNGSDGAYRSNGGITNPTGTSQTSGSTYTSGDIIGVSYNADTGEAQFYKNNVAQGATPSFTYSGSELLFPHVSVDNVSGTKTFIANFGQDSSFAGNETPQGNTDANGQGDFYYAPPSGFLALNRNNLPTPTILDPADYFNTVLYTGDGASSRSLTGVGFEPSLVWSKDRNSGYQHSLQDVVRGTGAGGKLYSSLTEAEGGANSVYGHITSFDSDGFSVATGTGGAQHVNQNTVTYAAWNWLAGGTAVSNTDGSITSSVSANTDAGFSVVGYTGTGSSATVGHGLLSSAPEMVIFKDRNTAVNWIVYHKDYTSNQYIQKLNSTDPQQDAGGSYALTRGSTTLGMLSGIAINKSGSDHIAYCFHSVEGYSKIGSYTGNGSTDGTYVHCGFRPAWIMVKRTDGASNWIVWDVKRDTYNVMDLGLLPNASNADVTGYNADALSSGFKLRDTEGALNTSGGSYIFLAFSEAPFKNANAR